MTPTTAPRLFGASLILVMLAGCGSGTGARSVSPSAASPSSVSPSTPDAPQTLPPATSTRTAPVPTTPVPRTSETSRTKGTTTVTGIPEPGVEASCLILGGYQLTGGDHALLTSGKSVTVTGHPDPSLASFCQQGVILVVESVRLSG